MLLGEGTVDWKFVFKVLAPPGFQGQISLHIEYETDGNTAAEKEANFLAAATRDLEFLRSHLVAAYGATTAQ